MFSERLRALRVAAGMTQEGLARAANLASATVGKLERIKDQDPSWSTVLALADALGVDMNAFREQPAAEEPTVEVKGKKKKGGGK